MSIIKWGRRETYYLLSSVLMMLLVLIPASITFIPFILFSHDFIDIEHIGQINYLVIYAVFLLPLYYFIARWSLILPDCALDNNRSLSWAWNLASDHSFRVFILVGTIPLFIGILFSITSIYLGDSKLVLFIEECIWLVVACIEVCLLSFTYDWLIKNNLNDQSISVDIS